MRQRTGLVVSLLMGWLALWAWPVQGQRVEPVGPGDRFAIPVPGTGTRLVLKLPGFYLVETKQDFGKRLKSFVGADQTKETVIQIHFERRPELKTNRACRDFGWELAQRSASYKREVRLSETKHLAVVEWVEGPPRHADGQTKNFLACLTQNGISIDLRLTKKNFKSGDEMVCWELLDSVHVER